MAGFYLMHIPGWLRLPAMVLFLAWRNLWRNPVRTGLTSTAMAVALIVMIVTAALREGMIRKMIAAVTRLNLATSRFTAGGSLTTESCTRCSLLPCSSISAGKPPTTMHRGPMPPGWPERGTFPPGFC